MYVYFYVATKRVAYRTSSLVIHLFHKDGSVQANKYLQVTSIHANKYLPSISFFIPLKKTNCLLFHLRPFLPSERNVSM